MRLKPFLSFQFQGLRFFSHCMVLHGSCTAWFCMSCFSAAVPSRLASVLRCMSVRTSRLPPFSFWAPFPSFRVLLGVSVSPCVRTPSSSSQPGPWRRVHGSLSCKFQLPFPLPLPCASLVPCQAAMFQVPRRSSPSPSCTVRRPQVTSASCLLPPGLRSVPQFFLPLGPVCACVTSARTAWVSP